ncbi:phosphatase PAP2 family protein [Caldisalinibacter kiritimatiensis]|uniref:Phosphatidylglycerophosphatase B n=1 Tax=Caldisalinibacter kiritimatiensis TaxID=1304284 RepID=R1CS99_9FIRM|nr:phosphatase PAP2 family protein [Caldisalinibacter kiritimatiensis]EOC99578.1 Phosphatidylglycerophosphatase B [Caldisalinibacter kiritimatiensis]
MNKIMKLVNTGDIKLLYIINDRIKCKFLDKTIPYITDLGSAFITILTCLLFIAFGKNGVRIAGYKALSALTTSHILVHLCKKKFTRPRPFLQLANINIFKTNLYDYSFPSGHTTAAFSISITLSLIFPQLSFILISLAFLVGISRIYLGVHYPTDVFVGMIIGTVFAILNSHLIDYII